MNERLTDNEFHSKDKKERACYIQEPRLQAIYDKCFEYEDIDTNPTRLANIKKAFEIISEKNVAITMIKQTQSVREYNVFAYDFLQIKRADEEKYKLSPQPLTSEEYGLVKEVLYGLPTKQVWCSN